ncbi:radial spoke binding protein 15 [Cochliomyia hominivorax]
MYHLIQRGKLRSQVINVPEGLPELLSDITREVLRCQPTTECLCQFIIDYLHSVIVTRDKAKIAKSIIDRALHTVDEVIADMCVCDIPKEKAEEMCAAMEECFRRFLAQRRCEKGKEKEIIKFKETDMLDELIKKCNFTKKEIKITKPVLEEAYQKFVNAYMTTKESTDGTDILYQYFREREIKRNEDRLQAEAAVKIQSNFRGFLARKSMFIDEPAKPSTHSSVDFEQDIMQLDMAARKIQQFFRRHISIVNTLEDPCSPPSNISLTARPPEHHDLVQEEPTQEKQHEHKEIKQNVDEKKENPAVQNIDDELNKDDNDEVKNAPEDVLDNNDVEQTQAD